MTTATKVFSSSYYAESPRRVLSSEDVDYLHLQKPCGMKVSKALKELMKLFPPMEVPVKKSPFEDFS